jgi:hypothetical protein
MIVKVWVTLGLVGCHRETEIELPDDATDEEIEAEARRDVRTDRMGLEQDMRSMGETTDCKGCRFWSEMIARSYGGPVEALCLSGDGPLAGHYVTPRMTCTAWKSGHHGAVDDPPDYGEATRALYAEEDGPPP